MRQCALPQRNKPSQQWPGSSAALGPPQLPVPAASPASARPPLSCPPAVIAHDVDPIEIVVWLPALCKKMGVPYCIVKGKARLGTVVHKKTATALALTAVKNEDQREFAKLVESFKVRAGRGGHACLPRSAAGWAGGGWLLGCTVGSPGRG